ncbi:hypothetical protein BS50DRAFT_43183 [Corynespora cassiicola Philippines]|uniref:Glyoxalase-like domain-containing protein n=1 Tax=Corynespora cassiicola Philippines TaxID=1448308 RepID=A0A2T2PD53_CORCC|nr:hypothetical protein BS50DRAFT_43183 [Corynespora cassiicola Philippines]
MASLPQLDHLVLFLPTAADEFPAVPPFISENFVLTLGGKHAHGVTSNTLILLRDGSYIELISFVGTPEGIANHYWGPDATRKGWTDWSVTASDGPDDKFEELVKLQLPYQAPRKGGRKRADGMDVHWAVIWPEGETGGQSVRGKIPFWCLDETPRISRVPVTEKNVVHPSGVLGVKSLTVVIRDQQEFRATIHVYERLFGEASSKKGGEALFEVDRICHVNGLESRTTVVLRTPRNEEELERTKERGFWYGDVTLSAIKEGKRTGERLRIDAHGLGDMGGFWVEYV